MTNGSISMKCSGKVTCIDAAATGIYEE